MKKLHIASKSIPPKVVVEQILVAVNEGVSEERAISAKSVREVLRAYHQVILSELIDNGIFLVPGIVRISRKYKEAKPRRKGINPFTKKEQWFEAKPATYACKVRPLSGAKLAVRGIH